MILKIVKVVIVFGVTLSIYTLLAHALRIEYLEDVKEKLAAKFLKKKV